MSTIGHAYVELRGLTNRLERDIERSLDPAVRRLGKNISENISDSIREGFNDVDASELQLDVGQAGDAAGRRLKEQIEDNLRDELKLPVSVDIDRAADDIDLFVAYVRERLREADFKITPPEWDEDDWKIVPHIDDSSMAEVKQRMDDLKNEYQKMEAELHPGIDFASSRYVSARMARMTRPRFATIFPVVDPMSARIATGILDALAAGSGLRMTSNTLRNIWDMFKNIDKSIPSITLMTTAVTGLSAWITSLVSDASHLVVELGRIAGIAIPLPGIFAGLALGIGSTVAVFRDFNAVLPEVSGMFSRLQSQMSLKFWEQARAPIQNMINTLFPEFSAGILRITGDLASFFSAFSTSLSTRLADEMGPMFDNLGQSILIATTYTDGFAEIIEILGRHGSAYLPRLANWFGEISTRFRNFLADAESSGELQKWTDQAIDNMGHLGRAIWGVGRIFYELGSIAEEAGGASLKSFADGLNGIANIIGREPFRSNLRRVFEEAHDAISVIVDTSGPAVTKFFENFADIVATTFKTLAPAIGTALREVAEALSGPRFTQGFKNFIDGISDGITSLSESFGPIGEALGSVGTILGEMARQFGPILGEVLTTVSSLVIGLEGPITGAIGFLSSLMNAFLDLPGPVQIAIASVIALRGPISTLGSTIAGVSFGTLITNVINAGSAMRAQAGNAAGFSAAVTTLRSEVGKASIALRSAFISSGIGAAIAVVAGAIGHFAMEAAEAKQRAQEYRDTLDDLGAATDATTQYITRAISETKNQNWLENIFGSGESIMERADQIGVAISDIKGYILGEEEAINRVNQAFDEYVNQFSPITDEHSSAKVQVMELTGLLDDEAEAFRDGSDEALRLARASDELRVEKEQSAEAARQEAEAQREAEEAHRKASAAIDTQVSSLSELVGLHRQMAGEILSTREAERGLEAAFDAATEAVENNGRTLDITTEAGRANQSALDDIAKSAYDLAESMYESGESTEAVSERMGAAREAFINSARAMGMSKDEATALADQLGLIPEQITTEIEANTQRALYNLDGLLVDINEAEGTITIGGDPATGQETLGELIGDVDSATGTVTINGQSFPAEMTVQEFHNWVEEQEAATVDVDANTMQAHANTRVWRDDEINRPVEVPVQSDTMSAHANTRVWRDDELNNPVDVPVGANTTDADSAVAATRQNASSPTTMNIDGDASGASGEVEGVRTDANQKPALLPINISHLATAGQVNELRNSIAETPATLTVNANVAGIMPAVLGAVIAINSTRPTLTIGANVNNAQAALTGLVISTETANPSVTIAANVAPSMAALRALMLQTNRSRGTVTILARSDSAQKILKYLMTSINKSRGTVDILGDSRSAQASLRAMVSRINRASGTVDIKASTNLASAAVTAFIARTNQRSATITIRTRRIETNADGGLYPAVQAFARGGIRRGENHVAQIARGGVTRIWAEPETGGEAYIPLAMSKRLRSLRILEQVAQIMGHYLVPMEGRSIRKFANGGILSRRDVSLLSRSTTNDGRIGDRARQTTANAQGPAQPVQITNNFHIQNANDLDVHTLAREVSREIMFKMK